MRNGDILPIEFMARREDWNYGVSIYMRQVIHGVGSRYAEKISMIERKPGELAEPMLNIDIQAAQQLMDELWKCGLRPSEGTGSAGSLAATERHLKDMQSIAMGLLKKHGV